jgi:two-component system sensor histidine kinase UhpB
MLFRIAQEALTNAAKHARAAKANVNLAIDNAMIFLTVSDDGCGFTPEQSAGRAGLGLIAMREMCEFFGGSFIIQSGAGLGTRIEVAIAQAGAQGAERRRHPRPDSI